MSSIVTRRTDLDMLGCVNLRDLGGLTNRRGQTLAAGRVFRSAELPTGGGAAANLATALGLRRVLDLRMTEEIERTGPSVLAPGCEWVRIPFFATLQPHWPRPLDRTPSSTAGRYFEMLEAGLPSLVRIVDYLGDAAKMPTLIHCVAGRDRTGIVIACLLDLLDVPDETVAADYALSSVVDDEEGRHASSENILLLLHLVRERFGSVREMLLASGSSVSAIDRLHEALLSERAGA